MTSAPSDPLIGHTLDDRYVIRSRIARGGMAMVYLATDLRLERRVAVKVMHEHLAEDDNFTRRFEQEARSAAALSHPNLVNVFDQGHDFGRTYLVMEYLPSITLRDLLKQQQRLTADQAMEIGEAILSGLAAAHHAGIVHRDLKPENVMLADDGRIKLGDFGLARAVSANTTTGQALLGTIAYLSPELVTRGVADERSDLYAFGIMLYEMLTGVQPFTGDQPMQIAYQHAHSEVPLPSAVSSEATPELDELVSWTTQRDPELRPTDAGEALSLLTQLRAGGSLPQHTRVLPTTPLTQEVTPETTVLGSVVPPQSRPGAIPPAATTPDVARSQESATEADAPLSAIDHAAAAARSRTKRGRIAAAVITVLVIAAGGFGWWFAQGPGGRVTIPDVVGLEITAAEASLTERSVLVEITECPSLDIAVGLAVSTTPPAGDRVERETVVQLCQSTGPRLLDVPTLVGLSQEDAENAITEAEFSFGSVLEERFSDAPAGEVLAALDADGNGVGATYLEQGRIDLIVSAGQIPEVAGATADDARATLTEAGLVPDPSADAEEYSSEVPAGNVLGLITLTDPVRPGDAVALRVSLGPELFEVPDVSNLDLQEAMDTLSAAGFSPSTLVPDALRSFAKATGTDPVAGKRVPAGTEIRVRSTISL